MSEFRECILCSLVRFFDGMNTFGAPRTIVATSGTRFFNSGHFHGYAIPERFVRLGLFAAFWLDSLPVVASIDVPYWSVLCAYDCSFRLILYQW